MKKKNSLLPLTRGAMIAALYVALTYASFLVGLSSGQIQFRISEALCVLPVFFPEATLELTIGCMLANIVTGSIPIDIFVGSFATLLGALGARLFGKLGWHRAAGIPTVIANTLLVPFVILWSATGGITPIAFLGVGAGVFLGEAVCAGIGGALLVGMIQKMKKQK